MFSQTHRSRAGYNLAEVMVVVVIMAAFAKIAFVQFGKNAERMKSAEGIKALQTLREAEEVYKQERGAYTATITNLGVTIPTMQFFDAPVLSTSDATALVSVTRTASSFSFGTVYTLKISQTGSITCTGGSYCPQLGF